MRRIRSDQESGMGVGDSIGQVDTGLICDQTVKPKWSKDNPLTQDTAYLNRCSASCNAAEG